MPLTTCSSGSCATIDETELAIETQDCVSESTQNIVLNFLIVVLVDKYKMLITVSGKEKAEKISMDSHDSSAATAQGITEEDRERIQAYLAEPTHRRTPHMLCPSEE